MSTSKKEYRIWFNLILLYLVFDYGRLHDTLHFGFARPLMLLIVIFIALVIQSGQLTTIRNGQVKLLWMFILLLSLYIPFARNNFLAYHASRTMFLYMPFIYSVVICINSIDRLKKILFFCTIIMAYIAIYSIVHHGIGPGNYFNDENDLSLYINTWIPFCYFLFFVEGKKITKIFYVISLFLGIVAIVISFSRGGLVGLGAVFFAIIMFSKRKIISLFSIAIFILIISIYTDQSYKEEMGTITDTGESTAVERIESWKSGWNMFLDNPLGVGGNNFLVRFSDYQTSYFKRGMWGRAAHSLWFTLIPELGICGIIIYSLLLYINIRDIRFLKNFYSQGQSNDAIFLNYVGCAFFASLSGFFASATFLSVLYYAHYWYMTSLIVAAVNIANRVKIDNGSIRDQEADPQVIQ